MFKKLAVGTMVIAGGAGAFLSSNDLHAKQLAPTNALAEPKTIYPFKLIEKKDITHDTRLYRFELPKNTVLGYLPGQHVRVKAKIGEKVESRAYSPTSDIDQQGFFDLVIKVYAESPLYPGGGKMTRYIDSLKIGDHLDMEGPVGRLKYFGNGAFSLMYNKGEPEHHKTFKNIGMVAGGTGMAPFYQTAKTISEEKAPTNVKMIFSNHTENDIIMRTELDELEKKNPEKFKIWYTITKSVLPNWKYDEGHVTVDMLKKHLPPPSDDTLIMVCGPPGFVKKHCIPLLMQIGHSEKNIFRY